MSSWEDRFSEHELWTKVTTLQDQLSEVEVPEDSGSRDSLEYMIAVAELVAARRHGTPAIQITENMLAGAAQATQAVIEQLTNWRDESINDTQMDNTAQGLVQALATWPPVTAEQHERAESAGVEKIAEMTASALEAVARRRDDLAGKLSDLESDQGILEEKVNEQVQATKSAVSTFETEAKEALDEAAGNWDAERKQQRSYAEKRLETLRELEKEARDLVHAATGSAVATDYGEYATNKNRAAWVCDIAAAIIGAAGVIALLVHLYSAEAGADGGVGLSLTRLAASLGTLGIAALVAHRGHDHHKEARAAKRTDLAIRRVGPFTANLPPDVRERITLDVTDRIFIRGELDEVGAEEASQRSLVERIHQMRSQNTEPPA